MSAISEERASDSPYVELVGRIQVEYEESFVCAADTRWNMMLAKYKGQTAFTVWGGTTKAMPMHYPQGAELMFIRFKVGTYLSCLPLNQLPDRGMILPDASSQSFWLDGSAWEFPDFDNADTYVEKLVQRGVLAHEPVVDAALQGRMRGTSPRSIQRRFLHSTGMTLKTIQQVNRAREAEVLLKQGVSILDTVHRLGYFDQSHLTNALKRYVGQTPARLTQTQPTR